MIRSLSMANPTTSVPHSLDVGALGWFSGMLGEAPRPVRGGDLDTRASVTPCWASPGQFAILNPRHLREA